MIKKKEIGAFFICVLVLAFAFGFDDGAIEFELLNWLNNLAMIFFLVLVCMVIYVGAQKLAAYRFDAYTTFRIWMVRRFKVAHKGYNPDKIKPVPLGIFLSILLSILTKAGLVFTGLWENIVGFFPHKRVGRDKVRVTEYEISKILFAGPGILILFVIILTWLSKFGYNVALISTIAYAIAFVNMVPIPGLDGSRIFFGSRSFWVFGFLFVICAFGLRFTGIIGSVLLSIVLAWLGMALYFYRWEK